MSTVTRRNLLRGGLAAGLGTAALSGCSIADDGSSGGGSSGGGTTVTVRLWDDTVQPAYEKSFEAFRAKNPGITPKIEMVPWASYWDKLPADVAGGTLPDVLWVNSSNFGVYVDSGTFLNISEELPDAVGGWQTTVVDQYTRKGALWGVPQLSDAIGLFYNRQLVQAAGVDPSNLTWNPAGTGDTFLPAAKALTRTEGARTQYGFNAAYDLQAIFYDFVGSNGGRWQADDDTYVFGDDQKSVAAMQYVVDLINRDEVSPSAADTNDNGDFSRDQFTQGTMALFQSGTYNLKNVADGAQFEWGIAPGLTGPRDASSSPTASWRWATRRRRTRPRPSRCWSGSAARRGPRPSGPRGPPSPPSRPPSRATSTTGRARASTSSRSSTPRPRRTSCPPRTAPRADRAGGGRRGPQGGVPRARPRRPGDEAGPGRGQRGDPRMSGRTRSSHQVPTKDCAVCGRTITWRKKWERDWDGVKYCSDACRRRAKSSSGLDADLETTLRRLLDERGRSKTVCPSEVARASAARTGATSWNRRDRPLAGSSRPGRPRSPRAVASSTRRPRRDPSACACAEGWA